MLDEVELLVAGFYREIVPHRRLVRPFGAEGRIGEDAVVPLASVRFVDSVAQVCSSIFIITAGR